MLVELSKFDIILEISILNLHLKLRFLESVLFLISSKNMQPVARLGDAISHGGTIVQGSPNFFCDGRPVARLGDTVICALHGPQKIVSASGKVFANNRGVARIGDSISCGATIVTGSPKLQID